MSELTTTPISSEVTKAELTLSLSKDGLAYQKLLQDGENLKFTKDGLVEQGTSLKTLRLVQKKLDEMENPYTANWKLWNSAKKSLTDPVADLLKRKEAEYRTLALEIEADKKKAEQERLRVSGIREAINTFFIGQSQAIAASQTLEELTGIEKLIGSHKANSSRYAEFLPELVEKASLLTPLIKTQKESIKKLEALKAAENAANEAGDDQAVIDARESQELLTDKIQEMSIKVQEKAIGMATKADVVEPEVVMPQSVSARRSVWTWEVVDIKETQKKMPNFVDLTPNKEKIDEYLKAKKAEGVSGDEFTVFGIKFYLKRTF